MGSGNHARVYILREPSGKLIQLPIAWYTKQQSWGMPPGYEDANQPELSRPVQRNCMTCHNAYAEVPVGADRSGHPNLFPADLPGGIGCQRCHGPGAEHVRLALVDRAPVAQSVAAILNPADFPQDRQRDLCASCHLQPAITIQGLNRHGTGFYSFRPGDRLSDHFLNMEFQDGDRAKSDRFDINHHPYRLEQSACFVESEGALGCTTCHNPHGKVPAADRAAYYKTKCLTCHDTDAAGLPQMASGDAHPAIEDTADCTTCHMPRRRTEDVIEVTMTDHLITRDPGPGDLTARVPKHVPSVRSVDLFEPAPGLTEPDKQSYVLSAILTYDGKGQPAATDALIANLSSRGATDYEPWLLALKTLVQQGRYDKAGEIASQLLQRAPGVPDVTANAALVRYASGAREEGKAMLRNLIAAQPRMTTPMMNLASIYAQERDFVAAAALLRQLLAQEPTSWKAWTLLARIEAATGETGAAIEAYFTALGIEPRALGNRKALSGLLSAAGRADEAARYAQ